ncbi:hypothetical protein TOT_010001035 [Theileria orientalis strain Shintoku]|uniref:Uncharacterized protein n=1 Tax=Theileria orientalis strain Shintoku TaxID=869250 RepID=J4C301_THEOR|nr:hypothetical protein TOT_010001035 [Theileria orientalis strain Shintoku]BAM39581.1 hypothetical protein TOT_010001035 [Theileria orientalis strain Shintoku]|eukprot:XP_009689882.1 hypothetical protein TOT_010001035 [Theileria orientalis strain Shintoku]
MGHSVARLTFCIHSCAFSGGLTLESSKPSTNTSNHVYELLIIFVT